MKTTTQQSRLGEALRCAELRLKIHPLNWITDDGRCSCGSDHKGDTRKYAKHPLLGGWQNKASSDPETVKEWWTKWPRANIGLLAGKANGIVVLDLDTYKEGYEAPKDVPETATVATGSGGQQLYYLYPEGHNVGSSTDVTGKGKGVDIRGDGGYAVAVGSEIHGGSYTWTGKIRPTAGKFHELLAPCQGWIIDLPKKKKNKKKKKKKKKATRKTAETPSTGKLSEIEKARECLKRLNSDRADNYEDWLHVGMVLHNMGVSLDDWIEWSKQSKEFEEDVCEEKWDSFDTDRDDKIGMGSLVTWAADDQNMTTADLSKEIGTGASPFSYKQTSQTNPTKVALTYREGGRTLHVESLDLANSKKRLKFVADLLEKNPDLSETEDELNQRLTDLADQLIEQPQAERSQTVDIDIDASSIVRPHLFYTAKVCGLSVPQLRLVSDAPVGHWSQCRQWDDGKRECQDLEQRLALPEEQYMWFAPTPSEPALTETCRWSQQSRDKWLGGYTPALDKLVMNLMEAIDHFLAFPPNEKDGCLIVLTLWTLMSYVYPVWPAIPYLSIGGPLGSGKSRVFDLLANLVFRPIGSSNMTAPCLFRTLDSRGGTLLLDEAERLRGHSPEVAEIMSILLAGYKKGQKAQRLEKEGDSFKLVSFDVFGPKAIACINELPPALASRCIRLTMFRAPKGSPMPMRRIDNYPHWQEIRDDLHCMALAYGHEFTRLAQQTFECEGLHGRDLEIWGPLLQLAQFIGDHGVQEVVEVVQEYAKKTTARHRDDSVPGADEAVLQATVRLLKLKVHGVTAAEVLVRVQQDEPALFSRYSAKGIAVILKRYGLQSTRGGGKSLFRPDDKQLQAIQDSYGINLGLEPVERAQSAHCALSKGYKS